MGNMKMIRQFRNVVLLFSLLFACAVPSPIFAWGNLIGPQIVSAGGYVINQAPFGESTQLYFINYLNNGHEDTLLNGKATFTSSNQAVAGSYKEPAII